MDTTANRVTRIVAEQMGLSEAEVKPTSKLVADLGADSLDSVELLMTFEEKFDLDISDAEGAACVTVEDCIGLIDRLLNKQTASA